MDANLQRMGGAAVDFHFRDAAGSRLSTGSDASARAAAAVAGAGGGAEATAAHSPPTLMKRASLFFSRRRLDTPPQPQPPGDAER